MCATGKVFSPVDDSLLVQSIIHEKQNLVSNNEFSLSADDIYKDLRVMGYDYSGEFQRLKNIRTNDFKEIQGICEWNGNVVTFLDGLMQSMILATPFRKLMIPVMIKTLRIDPKELYEAVNHYKILEQDQIMINGDKQRDFENKGSFSEVSDLDEKRMKTRFHLFKSSMPFYFDSISRLLVTHGIELEYVRVYEIPRKVDMVNLVLDSYEFVANKDNNAIESCDRKHIIEYLEVFLNNIFISFNNRYSLKGMQINGSETQTNRFQRY